MALIDVHSVETLRCRLSLNASVHLEGEPVYDAKQWGENTEKPAAAVACPANANDVVELLAFAQGKGVYVEQTRLDVTIKVKISPLPPMWCLDRWS
jgi:hypothetical protein